MAEHSVDYIIKLVADDKELKQKLSSGDFLNKKEISKIKTLLTSTMDAATRDAKNLGKSLQDGLDVDTGKLERTLQFIGGVFDQLEKTGNPIKDWAKTGAGVYKSFDNMQTSIASLAQNVNTLQTGLNNLTSSFQSFKDAYQSFKPTQFANVSKDIQQIVDASAKINANVTSELIDEKSVKRANALKTILTSLSKDKIKLNVADDDLAATWDKVSIEVEQLTDNIDGYKQSLRDTSLAENERKKIRQALTRDNTKLAQSYLKLMAIEERQVALGKVSFIAPTGDQEGYDKTIAEWEKQILSTTEKVQNALTKLESDINGAVGKSFAKVISEQISDIQLKLTLPNEQEFVNQINQYISKINDKPLDTIRVNIDDAANVIADKSRQQYKDKPASDDVNTDKLVEKTNQRFEKVIKAIGDKQQKILDNTNTWRNDMIKAMKIAASDLEFEFGWDKKIEGGAQLLKDALQSYFDMPGNELNIHIDHKALSEEIKAALGDGGFTVNNSGVTTIANLDELVSALTSVLIGKPTHGTRIPMSTSAQVPTQQKANLNDVVQAESQATETTKQYVTQLDTSAESTKELIDYLKQFADVLHGKKVFNGAKSIGDFLLSRGIDLDGIYQNKVSDEQIIAQLTDALLEQDQMGYAKGSTIAADLWKAIKDNKINTKSRKGSVVYGLPQAFNNLLSAHGVIIETAEEWAHRNDSFDVADYNIKAGRSLGLLNRARYPFRPDRKRNVNTDGGIWDIGNDLNSVIMNLKQEKDNLVAQLQKDKDELTEIRRKANMSKGDPKSQYQKDYYAAKQIYAEATIKRKQAENELTNARKILDTASTNDDKEQALKSYKVAKDNFDVAKKQEQEARHFEIETLGVWQNAKTKVKSLLASIEKKEKLLESFGSLESMQQHRIALGDNPTEDAMEKFKIAGLEFYQKSQELFSYLNSKFKFKGFVALDGSDELIPIQNPTDILKHIPEGAKITYAESYKDHSNSTVGGGFVGSSQNRNSSYKKANSQENRMIGADGKPEHLDVQHRTKDIINEVIDYAKFQALEAAKGIDFSGKREQEKIQQHDADITSKKNQLSEIDAKIANKEKELSALQEQDTKTSKKKKQKASEAVSNQEKIVEKIKVKQQETDDSLKEVETKIAQTQVTQSRLQQELEHVSDIDAQRKKNMIQVSIQRLAELEPILQKNVTSAQQEYDVSKSVYEYSDKLVAKRKADLSNAKQFGDQTLIEDASKALELSVKERINALTTFQNATQKLNEANSALESNLSQRNNLQNTIDNISINTIREDKQSQLNDISRQLQTLETTRSNLLVQQKREKESYDLVVDELSKLKDQTPYKIASQITQVQREKDVLESQKQQIAKDVSAKEQSKKELVFLSRRIDLQRTYGNLQEKSLQLQAEINSLEESDENLPQKKEELSQVNAELETTKIKIQDLGGFIEQSNTEISPDRRHQHGLDFANQYQKTLALAEQQRDALQDVIDGYVEKERQINKFGSSQYDIRKKIGTKKQSLRTEFLSSDYVKAELEYLKEKAEQEIQKARQIMDQRVRNLTSDVDPAYKQDYIRNNYPELFEEMAQQEEQIWAKYRESEKKRRQELLDEFNKNLIEKDGIVSARFKVNKDGQWVNGKRQPYDVKQEYLDDIVAKKKTRQAQLKALLPQIEDIKQQKLLAMTYGNVNESELAYNADTLAKKYGQATERVSEVVSSTENLSSNIDQVSDSLDKHYTNYETTNTSHHNGGVLGSLYDVARNNIVIDTSKLATEETLRAIFNLLGGDFVPVENNHLDENSAPKKLARNKKDPTDLDVNPSVQMSQDIEKKLLETIGKSLSLEELRKIIGTIAGDLFVSQGDPTRELDRDEFYEKNYSTIFEKAFAESQKQLKNEKTRTVETDKQLNIISKQTASKNQPSADSVAQVGDVLLRSWKSMGNLSEYTDKMKKAQYQFSYDEKYAFKPGRQTYWSGINNLLDTVDSLATSILTEVASSVRKGETVDIHRLLEFLDIGEAKLSEFDTFVSRPLKSEYKRGKPDAVKHREKYGENLQSVRQLLDSLTQPGMMAALQEYFEKFYPKTGIGFATIDSDIDEVKKFSQDKAEEYYIKAVNTKGNIDAKSINTLFYDIEQMLPKIEAVGLYAANINDGNTLNKANTALTMIGRILADTDKQVSVLPDSKEKNHYNVDKNILIEQGKAIRERFAQFLSNTITPDTIAKKVNEHIAEIPTEENISPIADKDDYKKAVEIVRNAIGDFKGRSDAKLAEKYKSLDRSTLDAANILRVRVKANEATKAEIALYNKIIKLREAFNRVQQQEVHVKNNVDSKTSAMLSKMSDEVSKFASHGMISDDLAKGFEKLLARHMSSDTDLDFTDEETKILLEINEKLQSVPHSLEENSIDKSLSADDKLEEQNNTALVHNTEALNTHTIALNNQTTDATTTNTNAQSNANGGGLIGIMRNELAKESTLKQVLTALGEIAKKNAMVNSGKSNSAQDLLEQFRRMLESDAWEGKERVAYLDLETGLMSNSITGDNKSISAERLHILRAAYKDVMDLNAQVHTHANEEDPYFSKDDLSLFASDFADGITKQILLSKNNMTVLDMANVSDVNGLLDALTKTEQSFEALATTADKFGAKYVSKTFSDITPQGLVKMLGIKGIESKYTETETRESARQGVLAEDAKEAADMLQESTGRAIKKTVERVGLELETLTEKTDVKGNKTWSSQISNKFGKAMKATNKEIESQKLDEQFGVGTKAANALEEYRTAYKQLTGYVEQFNNSTSDTEKSGLQKQINELIPVFNKAEKELVDLIARKEQFLRVGEKLDDVLSQSSIGKDSLEAIATREFFGDGLVAGQNIATAGTQSTKNGRQLLVDVLDNGTISRYGIEVDEVTGQVRKLELAEGDLVNAFQNVNRAMRDNKTVLASVAVGDNAEQVKQFLETASSPIWDTYKDSLAEMQTYTANLWNTMKAGKNVTQEELDYLMALSERVITLGKTVQKTSVDFKNFQAQNPESVFGIDKISYNPDNRDAKIRDELEKRAKIYANANNAAYNFSSFDNDILKFTLTNAKGEISKVTYEWNELYNQIAITSDASTKALDPMVAKINRYDEAIQQAVQDGYLITNDNNFDAFYDAMDGIHFLINGIEQGYETFETAKEKLYELRQEALKYGELTKKTIAQNKRLFSGTGAKKQVDNQYNKIVGTKRASEEQFSNDSKLFNTYENAYKGLNAKYQEYVDNHTLNDPKIQQQIQQQAVTVQVLGKKYLASVTQAEKLSDLVEQSGYYTDSKGVDRALGGISQPLTVDETKNLNTAMRTYAESVYGANLENIKINKTTKTLTGTLRTSKDTVADVAIQFNEATNSLYAYQKQERESLTGLAGFIHSMKGKMKSILQYTASVMSIHRVLGELKRGIQYIREIDSALTELKKVTDETEATYDRFLQTAAKTADKVGSTIKEVVSSTADWARLNI